MRFTCARLLFHYLLFNKSNNEAANFQQQNADSIWCEDTFLVFFVTCKFSIWNDGTLTRVVIIIIVGANRFHYTEYEAIIQVRHKMKSFLGTGCACMCELLSREFFFLLNYTFWQRQSQILENLFMWCWISKTGSSCETTV